MRIATLALAVSACGSPSVDCDSPWQKLTTGPRWVQLVHGERGARLVATAQTGISWADVSSDGRLGEPSNVDAPLWPWVQFPVRALSTTSGFVLVTDVGMTRVDTGDGSVHIARPEVPGYHDLDSAFRGADAIYVVLTGSAYDPASATWMVSARLARVSNDDDISTLGDAFDTTTGNGTIRPSSFGGGAWDDATGAFWISVPDGSVVELDMTGQVLGRFATSDVIRDWAPMPSGAWVGLAGNRLVTFSLPPTSLVTVAQLDAPGAETLDVEPDGTIWIAGHAGATVSLWRWREGDAPLASSTDSVEVSYCDIAFAGNPY
jgi:hypothetical protein